LLELTLESDFHNLYILGPISLDAYSTAYHAWKIECRQRRAIVMPLAEAEELIRTGHDVLSQTRAVEDSAIEGYVLQHLARELKKH
jgi:hypothetical protein